MPHIYDKDAFLFRVEVGTASGDAGSEFELSLINSHIAAVKDLSTGKTCAFDWQYLIERAIELGVSKED